MATPALPTPPSADATAAAAAAAPRVPPLTKNVPALSDRGALTGLLPDGDAGEAPPEDRPHHAAGFLNQPWVQNVLPLATSLTLHVAIIVLGVALYKAVAAVANPNKDQVIIPESKSIEKNAMPGGIQHPGLANDPTRDAAQDAIKNSAEDGFTASATNNIAAAAGGGSGNEDASAFEGASSSSGKGTNGSGGSGNAFGAGGGGGTAPWGVPGGGGGMLPKSNFFGTGGNATKVVYLCDASGSMLGVFGSLKQQLKESITNLKAVDSQQFNVIFFSDDKVSPLFSDGMHIASADNKKLALDFIDNQVPTGGTQPIKAINEAIKERPELLYVLTDGFDQIANFDDVINAFKAGNSNGGMHINCIFLQSDEDPKLVEVLKKIASDGHGDFKKILKSDM